MSKTKDNAIDKANAGKLTNDQLREQLILANERIAESDAKNKLLETMNHDMVAERDKAIKDMLTMRTLAVSGGTTINHLQNTNAQLISAAADSALAHRLDAQAFAEATRPRTMSAVNTEAKA